MARAEFFAPDLGWAQRPRVRESAFEQQRPAGALKIIDQYGLKPAQSEEVVGGRDGVNLRRYSVKADTRTSVRVLSDIDHHGLFM